MRSTFLIAMTALLASLVLIPSTSTGSHADDDEVVISVESNMGIEDLLRTVGKALDTPLLWDPQDKQIRGRQVIGAVDIRTARRNLLGTVRGLLTFYELVIIPVGSAGNELLLVMDARRTSSILKLKAVPIELNDGNLAAYEGADGLFVSTMIIAENLGDLRSARNALTRMVTGQNIGNVTEVPEANALFVQDFAPNVVAIYRVVRQMDDSAGGSRESSTGKTFRAVELVHARVSSVAPILTVLFPPPVPQSQRLPAPTAPTSTPPKAEGPRIQFDERTNQILVTGAPEEIQRVLEALSAVDVPVPTAGVEAHLIRLEHLSVRDAANDLSQIINQMPSLWRDGQGGLPRVVASTQTNALLVAADGDAFERIRRLVQEMDEIVAERQAAASAEK